jgi:hypothetical protein
MDDSTQSLDVDILSNFMMSDGGDEDYGICSQANVTQENANLILHLRVHSKQRPAQSESETTSSTASALPYTNKTYNDLMKYTPSLNEVPVAYEKDMSDSYPFLFNSMQPAGEEDATDAPPTAATDPEGIPTGDLVKSTDNTHCCWWCTYSFTHEPFAVPLRYTSNHTYNTLGRFCTPECCAAYIFDSKTSHGDPWKHYELLHRMVRKAVDGEPVHIKLAPPRETLQRFGGPYTIQKYRECLSNYKKDVRVTMTPIQPIHKNVEEVTVDYTKKTHKFLPIDTTRVKRAETELSLKRKKKHTSENTLETFMRLRITDQN